MIPVGDGSGILFSMWGLRAIIAQGRFVRRGVIDVRVSVGRGKDAVIKCEGAVRLEVYLM
jgi:hypothetical protein